tara:strand:+ start:490 stop:714 length:225 start_codon:yes stop_codon:yes gene_type:complete
MSNSSAIANETYSEEETERRREAALKRMLATPHKPHDKIKKRQKARGEAGAKYLIPAGFYDASDFDLSKFKAPQ